MTQPFLTLSENADVKSDQRGSLEVLYETKNMVLKRSFSKKGVFRGMHIQTPPYEQTKLIKVVEGCILDFVVDMTSENNKIFWKKITPNDHWVKIEPFMAHGFYAKEDSVFEYICDGGYNEQSEKTFSIRNFLNETAGLKVLNISDKDKAAEELEVVPGMSIEGLRIILR
jgi:dTDP-4-dehydrorhamnose 3,5-epimerase